MVAELSRLRAYNEHMHVALTSLDDVPIDQVELVLQWASWRPR